MNFSVEKITSLDSVKSGSRIHVIGVCGVAMAQIATQLAESGYQVSGSDKEFFEPMNSVLNSSRVRCLKGYSAEHLSSDLALVVIGNSVSKDNPEVQACDRLGLPYTIFPKLLYELAVSGRHSIVVAGTHGKTTSSAMLAYVLSSLGLQPSYFVGGRSRQLSSGLKVGSGKFSVVEGDEYDSSFFAKFAKFHFYRPDTLIITAIEFDHADIYADLDSIKSEFRKLLNNMPDGGTVIACTDDSGVAEFVGSLGQTKLNIISYGENSAAVVLLNFTTTSEGKNSLRFTSPSGNDCVISLRLPGRYNLKNAAACALAMEAAGLQLTAEVLAAFADFSGVDRRQQLWLSEPVVLIEDFAHHPTAVSQTLEGIRQWYPGRRLISIFEPRSNTSRRKIFQKQYVSAFQSADIVLMKEVEQRTIDKSEDLFDVSEVCSQIAQSGRQSRCFADISGIEEFIAENARKDDVIIVMSNGSFGGLIAKLAERLKHFPVIL